MPLSKYYGGSGEKVMKNMKKEYGDKKGKQVFYATANKRKDSEKGESKKHEKSESKAKEKIETGPSMNFRRKFGVK
jgi:hypothetical protein